MTSDFESGCEACRALAQHGVSPDVVRLSDRDETRLSLAMSADGGLARRAFEAYLRARGRAEGCILICGWDGDRESIARRRSLAARAIRDGRRRLPRPGPGPRLAAQPLRGPVPARDAARPRRLRRDARDLAHLVAARRALRRRQRRDRLRARGPGDARARPLPRLPPLPRRGVALLHLHGPAQGRGGDRAVARGQDRGLRGDRRRAAARSPITTRSAATTSPTWARRSASSASRRCGPSRRGSIPPGS